MAEHRFVGCPVVDGKKNMRLEALFAVGLNAICRQQFVLELNGLKAPLEQRRREGRPGRKTTMDRKDIEDFLRRSNSICENEVPPSDLSAVTVRRMSLAEFTGLDPKQKLAGRDMSAPAWRSSMSQTSLLNSFSARRRSFLATDVADSPTRRLAPQREESLDLRTAVERIDALREKTLTMTRRESEGATTSSFDGGDLNGERERAIDAIARIALVSRDINCTSSESSRKHGLLIAEATEAAECLQTAVKPLIEHSTVFHSQLVATESAQVLTSLAEFFRTLTEGSTSPTTAAVATASAHVNASLNVLHRVLVALEFR